MVGGYGQSFKDSESKTVIKSYKYGGKRMVGDYGHFGIAQASSQGLSYSGTETLGELDIN